nr:hypothetical protein [Tanacetum cinerariifolium]
MLQIDKNVADLLIKAFDLWSTAKAKTINKEAQIHAKVDGKKIIVTESSARRDLRLADEEDDVEMFDVNVLDGEELFVARQNINVVEEVVDDAQVKGIVFQEPEEPVKPEKKDQIRLDEEVALKLKAEFDKEAPRSPVYVPDLLELEDHVPAHIPEHPEDLVPAKDEAPIEAYIPKVASAPTPPLPPSFLFPRIRPLHTRAAMAQMRAAVPSTYHSLLPSGTPPLLPIPLPLPSTSRRVEIPEPNTPPQKRLLLTAPRPGCKVRESSAAAAARQPGPTMARSVDCSFVDTMETKFQDTERGMMTALEMVNMRTREALFRSEAYSRALEARVTVLETQARHHEWQHQTADDFAVNHIMRTQALEAGARIDTLEDTVEDDGKMHQSDSQRVLWDAYGPIGPICTACHGGTAVVSPTVESPGYIIDSEPKMDPEEKDGDDEKSEGDSIDYPTSRGDDDADDDDDLSEDDADGKDDSISASEDSNQTEPFEESETTATLQPSAYRVTARISVRPHIPMPFPSESEV